MAVPKRRVTKTKAAKRRTHYKLKNVATIQKCPSCGAFKQPHKICPSCGEY
jgi:large subunit ribosomal protein L32